MDLIISSSHIVVNGSIPFHVDRFNKNAVGLIVYMTEYLIVNATERGKDR